DEAIIPVALAADFFRKRCRRRRYDRAGRLVTQQLESERGSLDHGAVSTLVLECRDPSIPERDCLLQPLLRFVRCDREYLIVIVSQHEPRGLAGAHPQLRRRAHLIHAPPQVGWARECRGFVVVVGSEQSVLPRNDVRWLDRVVEPRRKADRYVHLPTRALHFPMDFGET